MPANSSHDELAAKLRKRIATAGVLDEHLRMSVARAGAGESADVNAPYGELAETIADASYRVTDAQVDAVRDVAGTDRAAFEVVMTACIGAGLARWDAAIRSIRKAADASG